MKGISEVIAIVLILMITIALAALAYTWFSGIFATMTGTASTAVTGTTGEMATQFRIESAKGVTGSPGWALVSIRNIGTQSINSSTAQIAFYVDGTLVTNFNGAAPLSCTGCSGGLILPSGVATYNISIILTCGTSVEKTTIGVGTSDSRTISC